MEEPKPEKFSGRGKHFIHFIRCKKNSLNSTLKLFFKSDQNDGDIARKLGAWASPGQTNMTSFFVTSDSTKLLCCMAVSSWRSSSIQSSSYRRRLCSTAAPILRWLCHDVYVCMCIFGYVGVYYVRTIKRKTQIGITWNLP